MKTYIYKFLRRKKSSYLVYQLVGSQDGYANRRDAEQGLKAAVSPEEYDQHRSSYIFKELEPDEVFEMIEMSAF